MDKYINADKLIDEIIFNEENGIIGSKEAIDIIQNMPSADVRENIHGEWVKTNPSTDTFECSLCGMQIPVPEMCSPFCPLCGADMRERRESDEQTADESN